LILAYPISPLLSPLPDLAFHNFMPLTYLVTNRPTAITPGQQLFSHTRTFTSTPTPPPTSYSTLSYVPRANPLHPIHPSLPAIQNLHHPHTLPSHNAKCRRSQPSLPVRNSSPITVDRCSRESHLVAFRCCHFSLRACCSVSRRATLLTCIRYFLMEPVVLLLCQSYYLPWLGDVCERRIFFFSFLCFLYMRRDWAA
jgi:hypothetical protein